MLSLFQENNTINTLSSLLSVKHYYWAKQEKGEQRQSVAKASGGRSAGMSLCTFLTSGGLSYSKNRLCGKKAIWLGQLFSCYQDTNGNAMD